MPRGPTLHERIPDSLEAELTERRKRKVVRERDSERAGNRAGLALVLFVAGIMMFIFGYREWRLSSLAKSAPQRISLAQLEAKGPGDNIWLDLTDTQLLLDQAVVQTQDGVRSYAWIPAIPAGNFGPPGAGRIRLIAGTKFADDARLQDLARQTTLRGIIVNATDSLGSEERRLLNEGLPGVDAASCYFFRVGQGPTSAAVHLGLLGGGMIALFAGLALGAYHFKDMIFPRR
jgi:hypothetical protein